MSGSSSPLEGLITTYVSINGCGSQWNHRRTGGIWNFSVSTEHINQVELRVVYLSPQILPTSSVTETTQVDPYMISSLMSN